MAEKFVRGIACAEEKARRVMHKYEKRQPLSDLEQEYNFKQLRPTLSVPIDNDDCAAIGGPATYGTGGPATDVISKYAMTPDETQTSPIPSFKSQRRSLSQSPAVRKKMHTWVKQPLVDSTVASRPQSGDRGGPHYEIETSVGKAVAAVLARAGGNDSRIRVGKNGYAVKTEHTATAAVSDTTLPLVETENLESPQALTSMLMAQPQPLSIEDAAKTCRVIPTRRMQSPAEPVVLSETRPVVFNEATENKPYLPFSIRSDSEAFKQQLAQLKAVQLQDVASTVMCLCKPSDVSLDVTYEEVLSIRAPASSAMSVEHVQLPVAQSPAPPYSPPATAATGLFGKVSPSAALAPANLTPGTNASLLRAEFRRCMKRQVTMPSYTVVRDVDVHGRRQRPDGAAHHGKHKSQPDKSPRPPHSSMAFHKAFGPTTPTITPNGVQGRKQYVAITSDLWAYRPQDSHLSLAALDDRSVGSGTRARSSTTRDASMSLSSAQMLHAHTPGNSASNHSVTALAAAGATSSGSDAAAAAHSSLASSLLAGRNTASSGKLSYRASQESSHDSRSALTERLRASRLSSAAAAYDEECAAEAGPSTWRQVSIPTAGAPSDASDDDYDCSLDGRLASASAAALATAAASAAAIAGGSSSSGYIGSHRQPGSRAASGLWRADEAATTQPAAAGSALAAATEEEAAAAAAELQQPAWRGGAGELRAMRSFIQEDLARTKMETQRMIQNVNRAKKQRSTSGHVLAQEWLS